MSEEFAHVNVFFTAQLKAKVQDLLSEDGGRVNAEEKKTLQAALDATSEDVEPVLNYTSLRIVCKYSLFSLKDMLKEGRILPSRLHADNSTTSDTTGNNNTKPSTELRERREYLLRRQQEKAYNQMVHGSDVDPTAPGKGTNGGLDMGKTVINQASIASNMVVSSLASFAIAYFIGQQLKATSTTCLIWGLIGSIVMLVVEMFLYILRTMRMQDEEDRIRNKENNADKGKGKGKGKGHINGTDKGNDSKKIEDYVVAAMDACDSKIKPVLAKKCD